MQEAIKCDMVCMDVSETINHMKKEKVLNIHEYTITAPKTKNGRWQTYIKTETGDRQKISATTDNGLYNKLYKHYFENDVKTLSSLYPEWLEKRREQGVSSRTVRRNENHWDKYYAGHKIITIPLHRLTADQIEQFFHECIRKYDLTVKELGNMKFLFVDMMKLAKRRKYIEDNPFLEVEVCLNGCRPVKKQNDTSRVYLPEEKELLFKALNKELLERPDCTDMYAVFLLFKLGLRIGELVALKWEDIDWKGQEVHIHHMETLEEDSAGNMVTVVAEYTKKKSPYGDRFLPLGEYELQLLRTVKEINERCEYNEKAYVFCDEEGRTTIREIDNLIRKACDKAGIETKSAHDIRRTVASEMFNQGVPVEIIRNYLGHADIKTTYGYILDNHRKEETNKMILSALSNLNGLKGTQAS